jgi:hypothetical protein
MQTRDEAIGILSGILEEYQYLTTKIELTQELLSEHSHELSAYEKEKLWDLGHSARQKTRQILEELEDMLPPREVPEAKEQPVQQNLPPENNNV